MPRFDLIYQNFDFKAGFILHARVYTRVCARIRAHTLNRSYSQRTVLRAYVRAYALVRKSSNQWTLKVGVDISSNQMRLRRSRSTNGYRRHGNLHAYTRVCSYLKFTTHLRGAILALGVAQCGACTRVFARWWSQKVWIRLNNAKIPSFSNSNSMNKLVHLIPYLSIGIVDYLARQQSHFIFFIHWTFVNNPFIRPSLKPFLTCKTNDR